MAALRRAAQALLLGLFVALPLVGGYFTPGQLLITHVWVCVIAFLTLAGRVSWGTRPGDRAFLGFLTLAVLATLFSVYKYASFLHLLQLADYLLVFWLARELLGGETWLRRGIWAIVAGGAIAAVWGLREYVLTAIFLGDRSWRIFGPFYNPNCIAGYLLLMLPLAVGLGLSAGTREKRTAPPPAAAPRRGKRKAPVPLVPTSTDAAPRYEEIAALFATVTAALAFLLTGSKGAALGFLISAIVYAIVAPAAGSRSGRALRLGTIAMIVAVALMAAALPPIRGRILAAFSDQSNSSAFRWYTWLGTADLVRARPLLGFGPGTFQYTYPQFARAGFTRMAHESYLQIAGEMGVPALLVLLFGVAAVVRALWRRVARAEGRTRTLLAAGLAGTAGFAAHNLVDYTWYAPAVAMAWWAMLGILTASGTAFSGEEKPVPVGEEVAIRGGLRAIMAAVLTITLILTGLAGRAQLLQSEANEDISSGRYGAAVDELTAAAHWNPLDAKTFATLSGVEDAMRSDPSRAKGALAAAVSARERATQLQPTEAVHWLALGRLYRDEGDLARAEAATGQALAHYPTYTKGLLQLARLQEQARRDAEAHQTYERLAAIYDTPVRKYVAIEGTVDVAFMYAWEALAKDADKRHDSKTALKYLRLALRQGMLVRESAATRKTIMQAAGGYDPEDAAHVESVGPDIARRLVKQGGDLQSHDLQSLTAAEFYQSLGDTQSAEEVLARLKDLDTSGTPLGRAISGRAMLRLWQITDGKDRSAQLRQKGVALLREARVEGDWDEDDQRMARELMK